jgi:hypothetical protein
LKIPKSAKVFQHLFGPIEALGGRSCVNLNSHGLIVGRIGL